MPKQRNHPHHHSSAWRAQRRAGLRVPVLRWAGWSSGGPYYEYPPGWVVRSPWKKVVFLYLSYALVTIIFIAAIFACAGGIMLWQTLTGAR